MRERPPLQVPEGDLDPDQPGNRAQGRFRKRRQYRPDLLQLVAEGEAKSAEAAATKERTKTVECDLALDLADLNSGYLADISPGLNSGMKP